MLAEVQKPIKKFAKLLPSGSETFVHHYAFFSEYVSQDVIV